MSVSLVIKYINGLLKMETTSAECLGQLAETHPKFTCQLSW